MRCAVEAKYRIEFPYLSKVDAKSDKKQLFTHLIRPYSKNSNRNSIAREASWFPYLQRPEARKLGTQDLDIDVASIDTARVRLEAELGAGSVFDIEATADQFRDPYRGPSAQHHLPSFVVQPSSVEEVQVILRVANETDTHVWTSGQGRNYGYGGAAPVLNSGIVLNLRRMNRIIDIDARNCVARIEPGVSFEQLYAAIKERDLPLITSVPDLGWGSVIGNALDHGCGYHIMGDHGAALCGMEVVLADGTILRTGQGAIPGSELWSCHKRSFGPALDDIFKQSNFGVVTQAGVWLAARPDIQKIGLIRCEDEQAIYPLIDMAVRLKREGILQGQPMMIGAPAGSEEDIGAFALSRLRPIFDFGRWGLRIGLYGRKDMVELRAKIVEESIADIPGASLELRTYPGDVSMEDVFPPDLVPAGIPNQMLLEQLEGLIGPFGHTDWSPVIPATGDAVILARNTLDRVLKKHNLTAAFACMVGDRSLVTPTMIFYDSDDAERVAATHAAVAELYEESVKWGCGGYRCHIGMMDLVASQQSFNGRALGKVYNTIKDALDPAGILSPGKSGIWPRKFRQN